MKRRTTAIGTGIVAVLGAIGLINMIAQRNYSAMLFPLALIALIWGLYKWYPRWAASNSGYKPRNTTASRTAAKPRPAATVAKTRTRKASPFRVIEGGKDDDGMPKYH